MTNPAEDPVLTIFTPAYNRAELLPRLFESIKQQVKPGDPVEWLVIDDGSTDNTAEVLASFSAERPDLVRHQRVANGGKHRAINRAAHAASGDWMLIVDSDDRLVFDAISQIRAVLASVHEDASVGVLRGLKHFPELKAGAMHFRVSRNPGLHAEWVATQRSFDTAEVVRTAALARHPFPEHPGERFMAESWLWHNLDKTHLTFFLNQTWIECFYQPGGLSAQSRVIRAKSPLSSMDVYEAMYRSGASWHVSARAAINWWRFWYHARRNLHGLHKSSTLPTLFAPLGWLLYRHDQGHGQ